MWMLQKSKNNYDACVDNITNLLMTGTAREEKSHFTNPKEDANIWILQRKEKNNYDFANITAHNYLIVLQKRISYWIYTSETNNESFFKKCNSKGNIFLFFNSPQA